MYGRIVLPIILVALVISAPMLSGEIVVNDALGRTVKLSSIPSRVVSLAPSITEIIFCLGLQDKLVGVDSISYNDTFYNISSHVREHGVESVGGYWWSAISVEKILSLDPDIVLADAGAHKPLLKTFDENDITVIFLKGGSASSINDIYNDILIIARIFNVSESRVYRVVSDIESKIAEARSIILNATGGTPLKVLIVVGFYQGIWVAGKATFIDDLLARLSLINAAGVVGWKAVNIEAIDSWDPDVIIVTSMGMVGEDVLKESGLLDLGKPIIILNATATSLLTRPGPLIGLGAEILAKNLIERIKPAKPATTTISPTTSATPITTTSPTTTMTTAATTTTTTRSKAGVKGAEVTTPSIQWILSIIVIIIVLVVAVVIVRRILR